MTDSNRDFKNYCANCGSKLVSYEAKMANPHGEGKFCVRCTMLYKEQNLRRSKTSFIEVKGDIEDKCVKCEAPFGRSEARLPNPHGEGELCTVCSVSYRDQNSRRSKTSFIEVKGDIDYSSFLIPLIGLTLGLWILFNLWF